VPAVEVPLRPLPSALVAVVLPWLPWLLLAVASPSDCEPSPEEESDGEESELPLPLVDDGRRREPPREGVTRVVALTLAACTYIHARCGITSLSPHAPTRSTRAT
jgi:hypothetical protein